MAAGILGGGLKYQLASHWGIRLDTRVSFSKNAASTLGITAGQPLSVSWATPGGRSAFDWIALLKIGDSSTSYESGWWDYTKGAASGTFTLNAPIQPGDYEFRYLPDDGYIEAGRSSPVTVTAPASP